MFGHIISAELAAMFYDVRTAVVAPDLKRRNMQPRKQKYRPSYLEGFLLLLFKEDSITATPSSKEKLERRTGGVVVLYCI